MNARRLILGLVVLLPLALLAGPGPRTAGADGIFDASYAQTAAFQDALSGTTMTLAFDGTSYWSSSGGSPGGTRLAQYTSAGTFVAAYAPGIDFRSVFTLGDAGPVYARGFASAQVQVQTAPGAFTPFVTLAGGPLDAQSSVVLRDDGSEFLAMYAGTVARWDSLTGAFLGTVTLSGFGTLFSENVYPQDRGVAHVGGYYLTYSNGYLSAWDAGGNRVGTTQLLGAGTSFDSNFSLSFANGMVWVVDTAGGAWRGYSLPPLVGDPPEVACSVVRGVLYPARGALLPIGLSFDGTDPDGQSPPFLHRIAVYSDEGNGSAPLTPDALEGNEDLLLRAERAVTGDGRVYLIVVEMMDEAGLIGRGCCTVVVPKAATVSSLAAVQGQAQAAEDSCAQGQLPPPGYVLLFEYSPEPPPA